MRPTPLALSVVLCALSLSATAAPLGDVTADGRVNAADLLLVRSHLSGDRTLSTGEEAAADVAPLVSGAPQSDGAVTIADLLVLTRVARGELDLNRPPVFVPVGPQSVAVGARLSLTVSAPDPDGDATTLSVLPLPLPEGMTFDPGTGELVFDPHANQVGSLNLSFSATDGRAAATEEVAITVEAAFAGAATAIAGQVLDATDFTPVEGVTIRELGCAGPCPETTTDAGGDFTLAALTPGERTFEFDGSTASGPIVYVGYRALIEIPPDRTTTLTRPVYLARLDSAASTPIPPQGDTVVTNANLGAGFSLVVAEGTIEDEQGNPVTTGEVNVTSVPPDFTPGALPEELNPDQVITVQPVGTGTSQIVFTQPAAVTFENTQGYAPDTVVDIWSLDHDTGRFFVSGTGTVSTDGSVIETTAGGIRGSSWHFVMAAATDASVADDATLAFLEGGMCPASGPPPSGQAPMSMEAGSDVTVANGCLGTVVALPVTVTRGAARGVELVYKSARAHPRPVIPFEPEIPVLSAVPDRLSYEVLLGGGVGDGSATFVDTSGLNENQTETVRAAVSFDASALPTGLYPVRVRTTSHFASASVASNLFADVAVVNGLESPLGAGWEVAELQRLHLQADGSAVVADGRGGYSHFKAVFDGARVVQLLGDGEEATPPATLELGVFTDPANVRVIPERASVELQRRLRVDHFPLGPLTDPNDGQGRSIRSGEVVSSYLIHFDTGGASAQPFVTLDFDRRILGVIFEAQALDETDALLGAPLSVYPTGEPSRGVEISATEWVSIAAGSAHKRLQIQLQETSGLDQIRVITEARNTIVREQLDDRGPPAFDKGLLGNFDQLKTRPSGTSDLIGEGVGGTFPESGLIVVFDGPEGGLGEGWIGNLSLAPGEYELAFGAMNVGTQPHALRVYLGGGPFDETIQLTNGNALSTVVRRFTLASPFVGLLNFDGGGTPDDHQGPAVDHIVLARLEESREWVAPPGDRTTLTEGPSGGLVRTYPDGSEVRFDATGLQTAHIDPNGNQTQYAYDGQDRITTIVQEIPGASTNPTTTFSYSASQVTITDPAQRVTVLDLDARNDLVRVTLPDTTTREFTYDGRHLLREEIDGRGFASFHEYDFLGRLARVRLADNTLRTVTNAQAVGLVDPNSGLGTEANPAPVQQPPAESLVVDAEGRSTAIGPGAAGAAIAVADVATGLVTTTLRDAAGNPLETVLPSGHTLTRTFDERGNVTSVLDSVLGGTVLLTYDPTHSGVTSITDSRDKTTDITYIGVDVDSVTSELGRTTDFGYGSNTDGLVDTVTDVFGTVTRFVYDPETRNLREIRQADGAPSERVTAFTYTAEGYVDTLTDAENQVTDFDYDAMGRVTRQTFPGGTRFVDFTYDETGNLKTLIPPGQPAHVFRYDGRSREEEYEPPDVGLPDERTLFDYNGESQLTRVTRPDGKVVALDYDTSGRLDEVTFDRGVVDLDYAPTTGLLQTLTAPGPETLALDYGPPASSLLHGMTWSGTVAGAVTWAFDGDGRLKDRSVNGVDLLPGDDDFEYDDDGLLVQAGAIQMDRDLTSGFLTQTDLDLVRTTLAPNAFGERDSDEAVFDPSGLDTLLYRNAYTQRDKLGRITTKVETIGTPAVVTTTTYTYTQAGQLDTVHENGILVADHAYDANGNRTHLREDLGGPPIASYDAQDRLVSFQGTTYGYNAAGDLESKQSGADLTQYSYDALGNLTQVILPDGTQIDYVIDAANRRVGKKVDGTLEWGLLYGDALNPVAQTDDQGQVTTRFVYGSRPHVPDAMIRGGTTYRILSDHLGSVRLVVDAATGVVAQRIDYDVWGNPTYVTGLKDFQPFGFAGGLHDPETGLVRFGARDYDPETGRWTAKDPISFEGADSNLYAYVFLDPVNFGDATGLQGNPFGPSVSQRATSLAARGKMRELTNLLESIRGQALSQKTREKLLSQCKNVLERQAKEAQRRFRRDPDFRRFIDREFKQEVRNKGPQRNPNMTAQDWVDAMEEFFRR